uniref:Phosphofructokinase domain-containing protein n=1 Tax=Bicosoecida sp. CB-2014 TaxID=1486930 RepID=A0A7S1CPN8_9STRA
MYVIGGDGSHRGAHALYEHFRSLGLNISVACVPKTVDNDIAFIDRSFGFATAVEEAQRAILSAKTEAKCAPNGIGIVKLMGRSSGYIAAHATLASGDADVCLIPEVPTVLDGPTGCLGHVQRVLEARGHAVVVVAEGVGEQLLLDPTRKDIERDASGNVKLPPIAPWLKDRVVEFFEAQGITVNVKVLDPSYMIRSVKANASDSLYCMLLAQNVVHGVMAGYTGFSVALVNNRLVYLPMTSITKNSPAFMNPRGRTWERILSATRQPNTMVDDKAPAKKSEDPSE